MLKFNLSKIDLSKVDSSKVVSVVLKFVVVSVLSVLYCSFILGFFDLKELSVRNTYYLSILVALAISFLYKPLKNAIVGESFFKVVGDILIFLILNFAIQFIALVIGSSFSSYTLLSQSIVGVISIPVTYYVLKFIRAKLTIKEN